ncbi:hypothetical protein BBJ28_00011180 [Nothophytophthora sp. Chile5]|nr:hypothetical protein BBJ28_00011180 [Nothophytophthora sp. Chile5]
MRVAYAVQASLAISVVVAASYNPQHVVLGINGQVVVDADPSLFFRRSRSQLRPRPQQLEVEQPPSRRLGFGFDPQAASRVSPECEAKALPAIVLPTVHDALLAVRGMEASIQETEEDEFSTNTELSNAALAWSRVAVVDENDVPGVYGSVVFAELVRASTSLYWF